MVGQRLLEVPHVYRPITPEWANPEANSGITQANTSIFIVSAADIELPAICCIIDSMTTRSYNQYCPLAYALDLVGERWTLLIVRELLAGPHRFKDLLAGLPGISTNLLTDRLKVLEQEGLLRRRVLPPPAGSTVYELTAEGRTLEGVVLELGRWGAHLLPPALDDDALPSLGSCALGIKAFFRPEQARGVAETYEWRLGEGILQVRINAGTLHVQQGEAWKADAVFHTDMPTYLGLFSGQLTPEATLAGDLIRIDGDPITLIRFLNACGLSTTG
jgi:DNA-binding HxlR family transcriptional regulator